MDLSPKVSVLVPIYGVEKYIERNARSLFSQDYDNIEYIFVDDCSPDNSVAILQSVLNNYPNRASQVTILRHEQNRGLAATRNTALDSSSGDFLLLIDSDDWLSSNNVVSKLVETAVGDSADIVVFDFKNIYVDGEKKCRKNIPTDKKKYLKFIIEHRITASLCTCFYRASLFKDNGIRNVEGINMGEDYSVQPRLIYYAKKISYLQEFIYCYFRSNENSYVNTYNGPKSKNQALEVIENFFCAKPDYDEYKSSLAAARHISVAREFVAWAKFSGDVNIYKQIPRVSSLNYLTNRRLMTKYKIVLLFNQLRLHRLFHFIVKRMMYKVS